MNSPSLRVRRLDALDESRIDGLANVLMDCVEGGASVSFMHPFTRDRASADVNLNRSLAVVLFSNGFICRRRLGTCKFGRTRIRINKP